MVIADEEQVLSGGKVDGKAMGRCFLMVLLFLY